MGFSLGAIVDRFVNFYAGPFEGFVGKLVLIAILGYMMWRIYSSKSKSNSSTQYKYKG